eukprot:5286218-Pyramimonas_sp.AAC.1
MIIIAKAPGDRCDRQKAYVQRAQTKLDKAKDARDMARIHYEETDSKCSQRERELARAQVLLDQLEKVRPPPSTSHDVGMGSSAPPTPPAD